MDRFKTDFHNHSFRSRCAWPEMMVAAIARRFEECGLEMAGISDHSYPDGGLAERCLATREELKALAPKVDIRVGVELDIYYPGKVAIPPKELDIFDYVLVACTHYQNRGSVALPISMEYEVVAQNMVDFMTYAASLEFADAIAHPFHVTGLEEHRPDFDRTRAIDLIPDDALRRIARDMRENAVAAELHTSLLEQDYAASMVRFYAICKQEKVRFSLGSDAHWLSGIWEVPQIMDYIRNLGITSDDIWIPGEGK